MSLLNNFYQSLSDALLDFVYPPVCVSCGAYLHDQHQKVCDNCWRSIKLVTTDEYLYRDTREKLLSAGFVSEVVSPYVFEKQGSFQHIAHALKYQNYQSLGFQLGIKLGGVMKDWGMKADVIIPIPLHKAKFRERGFNQAEMIALGVSEVTGAPVRVDIIKRRRHTQTQTKLDLEERRKNMEDAFSVSPAVSGFLANKTCIVVDDVITTGATITSCACELVKAGATKVIAGSAALAQKGAA